jgi:hypothetical protein
VSPIDTDVSAGKDNLDNCSYCLKPLEMEAVRFGFSETCSAVFVCPNCGLIRVDRTPSIAKRILAYVTRGRGQP